MTRTHKHAQDEHTRRTTNANTISSMMSMAAEMTASFNVDDVDVSSCNCAGISSEPTACLSRVCRSVSRESWEAPHCTVELSASRATALRPRRLRRFCLESVGPALNSPEMLTI